MKINVFRVSCDKVPNLTVELKKNEYESVSDRKDEQVYSVLFLQKKHSSSEGWLSFYKGFASEEVLEQYTKFVGRNTISGVFIVKTGKYAYAVTHGQAHFIVRKYCDKDFGLDLAERIVDPNGLKMKHSQTFTAAGKKDITSYIGKRNLDRSQDYGEAFSYLKCKTCDKKRWGETADFGESVRLTFGKDFSFMATELVALTDRIDEALKSDAVLKLPRYRKVVDKETLDYLSGALKQHFMDYLNRVDVDDYWLTGVSFNFSNDYKYIVRYKRKDISEGVLDSVDANIIRNIIEKNKATIGEDYEGIKVVLCDEDDEPIITKNLLELAEVTIEHNKKYYVLLRNEWVEFSESYVAYIQEQVDSIAFEKKKIKYKTETKLIDEEAKNGRYTQLHKANVYISKFCIEKADLMDDQNVIMVKGQNNQTDLVYLIKQATTSLRLSASGELGENVFRGRNVCLWMLVKRKNLKKLSDFRSFHLLDALNDFKREVTYMGLTPVVWVSFLEK